jgi:hypothetical protein
VTRKPNVIVRYFRALDEEENDALAKIGLMNVEQRWRVEDAYQNRRLAAIIVLVILGGALVIGVVCLPWFLSVPIAVYAFVRLVVYALSTPEDAS